MSGLAIFDLDGTMLDTLPDIAASVNRARKRLSLPPLPVEAISAAIGNGQRTLVERTISDSGCDVPFEERLAIQKEEYSRGLHDLTRPYPGVAETLRRLKEAGWKTAALSNKGDADTKDILAYVGWSPFFAFVQGAAPGIPLKPDPAVIDLAIRATGFPGPRGDVWMVGDNYTDLEAARRAGIRRCFCRYGYGNPRGETWDLAVDSIAEWADAVLVRTQAPVSGRH